MLRVLRSSGSGFVMVLGLALLSGCGGGSKEDEEPTIEDFSCTFQAELTGAIERELPQEDFLCAYSLSFDSGASVVMAPLSEPIITVTLDISDVMSGQTGEFPAAVSFTDDMDNSFGPATCTVEVTTHEPDPDGVDDFGTPYRLWGSGSCSTAAISMTDTTQAVEISDFEFATPASFSE